MQSSCETTMFRLFETCIQTLKVLRRPLSSVQVGRFICTWDSSVFHLRCAVKGKCSFSGSPTSAALISQSLFSQISNMTNRKRKFRTTIFIINVYVWLHGDFLFIHYFFIIVVFRFWILLPCTVDLCEVVIWLLVILNGAWMLQGKVIETFSRDWHLKSVLLCQFYEVWIIKGDKEQRERDVILSNFNTTIIST